MSEAKAANPLVDQFRKGGVAKELRLMAAQGALPLKPVDLIELLQILLADKDEQIRQTAGSTLESRPEAEMLPLMTDRETPPEVLDWGLRHRRESALREAALQNTTTPDETIEAVASDLPEALAELVVINQVRLLRRTSLLEAIEGNQELNNDQRRRLRELRETFHIGEEEEEAPAAPEPEPEPPPVEEPEPEPEPEEEAPEEPADGEKLAEELLTDEEKKEEKKLGAAQKLLGLNTAGKMMQALKGSREERAILIRDPNRIVSSAVLGSPKVTEGEIESFSAMKNISDEILRAIGTNREWTRNYGVMSNLVRNPRTPLAISMGMVARLNPRDIRMIAVDRNVPEPIRKAAQRFAKASQR